MNKCLFITLLVHFLTFVKSEIILSANDLMEIRDQVEIVDFRGENAHDLDGFIQGSIALPDILDEKSLENLR